MEFDQQIADRFCDLYAHDARNTVQKICRRADMPSYSTINKWLASQDGFANQYARAREHRAELFADEIVSIADEAEGEVESAVVQAARLRVEARKWCASKLLPRVYGEKLETINTSTVTVTDSRDSLRDKILSFDVDGAAHAPTRLPH